jgi:hypothetical protein
LRDLPQFTEITGAALEKRRRLQEPRLLEAHAAIAPQSY